MQEKIENFKKITIENFKNEKFKFHEWFVDHHLKIVERIAAETCDLYPQADRDLVMVLVWFHDFGKAFTEEVEHDATKKYGVKALQNCGFDSPFIENVVNSWNLMEQKNTIDIATTPLEVQIISSADGASHFVGMFYPSYFGDNDGKLWVTQQRLREKILKDWNKKITIPEIKESFEQRYFFAFEFLGDFPDSFL